MTDIRPQIAQLSFTDSEDHQLVAQKLVQQWKKSNNSSIIHYMYYASYVLLHKNSNLLNDYLLADHLLVDGIGMQICFKIITGKKIANLNGTDMSPLFMDALVAQNIPIVLFGTTKENIQACNKKLTEKYNKNVVAYFQDGFSSLDLSKVPDKSALFIGMGSPRQEEWVTNNIQWIREKQLMVFTVGGFFDFLSGFYIRAPKLVRMVKMEWAWRTMLHPGRHYQKRLRDLTIIFLPFIHKMKGYSKYIHFNKI
jgi:exopolysaccharide biosynthesis WecB/TagA/CpsF family protein